MPRVQASVCTCHAVSHVCACVRAGYEYQIRAGPAAMLTSDPDLRAEIQCVLRACARIFALAQA